MKQNKIAEKSLTFEKGKGLFFVVKDESSCGAKNFPHNQIFYKVPKKRAIKSANLTFFKGNKEHLIPR